MTFNRIKSGYSVVDSEALEDALCDMAVVEFEPYEAAKSVISDIVHCESEEKFKIMNNFFIGIFGWSLETLLRRAEGEAS